MWFLLSRMPVPTVKHTSSLTINNTAVNNNNRTSSLLRPWVHFHNALFLNTISPVYFSIHKCLRPTQLVSRASSFAHPSFEPHPVLLHCFLPLPKPIRVWNQHTNIQGEARVCNSGTWIYHRSVRFRPVSGKSHRQLYVFFLLQSSWDSSSI